MDSMISLITVCFALLMVLCYCGKCFYLKVTPRNHVMVGITLKSSGMIVGLLLIIGAIFPYIKGYLIQVDLYLLIAGLSVLAVSFEGIYHVFFHYDDKE